MIARRRRHALLLPLLAALIALARPLDGAALNPCADGGTDRPDEGGIGGTGDRPTSDEGGIGGTGARPGDEGGIGGTGFTGHGAIGVIGTITGFGSICVGPAEVHYDAATPVQVDGRRRDASTLAVGQVVELVADSTGGELHAREVAVRHVVRGPITRLDAGADRVEVMGQVIVLPAESSAAWALGDGVQVSGMRRSDGAIVATRVGRLDASDVVTLTGPWRPDTNGGGSIAATRVETVELRPIPTDAEVRVTGVWNGGAIRAASIAVLPALPFDGRVERVALEGFARPTADGRLRVDSFVVTGTAAADIAALHGADVRVRVEALVRDRGLVVERAERVEVLPRGPARREGGPGRGPERGGPGPGSDPGEARPDRDGMPPPRPDGAPMHPEGDRPDRPQRPDRPDRPEPPERPDIPRPERPNHAGPPPPPDRPPR